MTEFPKVKPVSRLAKEMGSSTGLTVHLLS